MFCSDTLVAVEAERVYVGSVSCVWHKTMYFDKAHTQCVYEQSSKYEGKGFIVESLDCVILYFPLQKSGASFTDTPRQSIIRAFEMLHEKVQGRINNSEEGNSKQ